MRADSLERWRGRLLTFINLITTETPLVAGFVMQGYFESKYLGTGLNRPLKLLYDKNVSNIKKLFAPPPQSCLSAGDDPYPGGHIDAVCF